MKQSLLRAFAAAVLAASACMPVAPAQSTQTAQPNQSDAKYQEMNPNDSSRVTLPPPNDVKTREEGGSLILEWARSRIKRVVEYKIFSIDEKAGKTVEIGHTKDTNFKLGKPAKELTYGVAAVDYRGNVGAVSVVKPKEAAKQ